MKIIYSLHHILTLALGLTLGTFSANAQTSHQHHSSNYPSNCVASPEPVVINQPNGTSITVIGKGNLNNHWTETVDGYSVKRNSSGNYEYAIKQNGELLPGGTLASNPQNRSMVESNYVSGLQASLKPDMSPLKTSILNQVNAHLQNKTYPTSGNVRILALLIDYPDLVNVIPVSGFDTLLWGANSVSGDESFKTFYETSSGNQLTVTVDVRGWYRAANNFQYYAADSGYDRAASLVQEAVDAAEIAGTNFSLYDNDSDGDVDGILAVHSGPGAEIGAQSGLYIWSHRWNFSSAGIGSSFYDGVSISDYMINPEVRSATNQTISGIGVFCHEFGHNLGLPDLYDTDNSNGDSEGIGNWCLMAGGAYSGGSNRPTNFSAWCKIENGWDTPTQLTIGNTGIYSLNPSSTTRDEILQINTALSNEYFLLENRQLVGLDSDIPGTGMAIWHINTTKTNSFGNRVNGDETMKGVDLEEADGNDDLDNEVNRGDGGDLFPGSSNRTTFDDNTTPNAQTYTLANTNLQIRNIAESAGVVTFDFGQVPGAPCAASTNLTTATGSFDDGSGAGLDYVNNQTCSWLIQPTTSGTITLSFSSFDTEPINDTLTVYDGATSTAPLLGRFSGNVIPPNISSTGNVMYVEFNTNATINAPGFDASYVTNVPVIPCSGATTLTTPTGTFDDGSGTGNYQNNQNCSWLIQPPGAASITFGLSNLATEISTDIITVYDGTSASAPILGSYSGTNNLNTLTSSTGSIFVTFITNSSVTDQGFDAFYTSTTSSAGCSGATTFTANSGSFSDGSMANNYNNNQFCSWLIQPTAGTITLSFSAFSTEASLDRVLVFDGIDNTAPQIGNFSGSTIPSSLTSSANSLYIEFRTNGSITDQGWDASYTTNVTTTPTCSGTTTLNATSGTFNDGSGPNVNYTNNLACTWLISQVGINNIRLTVDSLNLASNDSIIVYDGASNTSPLLAVYKGSTLPPFITSAGTALFIEFFTDGSGVDKGWQMTYQTFSGCTGRQTLTASAGTFNDGTSATQNYANRLTCEWLIQPPGANFIELSFNRFATENCCDAVTVYDGATTSSTILGNFRGNNIPPNLISSGGSMLVRFTTDGSVVNRGWEASYASTTTFCLPNRNLTAATGSISDGSGTSNYENNTNCSWLITPPFSSSITLTFTNFNTEASNDVVLIYDGIDNTGTLVATYSGSSIPAAVTVNGPAMYVEFNTNGSTTAAGWSANYTSVGGTSCSGTTTLTAANGTFDDGSGLSNYSSNLNCGWLIQPTGTPALITLNMTAMNLANFGDRVRVYDGTSNTGTLLASYFGTNTVPIANAYSGSMFVEFVTDNFAESQGWTAVYSTSSSYCLPNTTFTNNFGNFTDGSPFGQNYLDNTDCAWLIQPAVTNQIISINFNQIDTELANDTITIYDGATTADPILNTLSGFFTFGSVPVITSTGGEMLVTFKSNGTTTASGWNASYNTQTAPACSGTTTLTAASGTFDDGSPAISNYIENSNCSWLIQPTGASVISLSFNRFDTELSQDLVTVYDGPDNTFPVLGTFSGQTIPNALLSSGNALFVEFTSNPFFNLTGWEASYLSTNNQCFANLPLTAFRDTIEDGSGSNNYSNNLNCSWIIQPPTATSVTLNFLNFDVSNPGDTLKIYDGATSSATLLAALTGTSLPTAITSTGGNMFIEFITDGSSTAAGWRAFYDITSSLSCIGTTTLTGATGSFNDGSGTGNYDNNLNCSWLIQPTGSPALITLTMNTLSLANFGDFIRVYDGPNNASPLIGSFFGTFIGAPLNAFSGSMFIEFTTDNFATGAGWSASYTTSSTYCLANTTLTANFGNFDDGSPFGRNYLNNTSCEWLIQPVTPNVAVRLNFSSFDTEAINDTVTIYDGATTADPILGTFSGNTLPPVLTSSGGNMLVTFKSNGTATEDGWFAFYQTQQIPACAGQTTLTAAAGTFNDGSATTAQYVENSNCSWLIQPSGALNIDLTFSRFNTQVNFDFVTVYDGANNSAPVLGTFSGSTLPPVINGSTSSMFVEFITNGFVNQTGWAASYTSFNTVVVDVPIDTVFINAGAGSTVSLNLTSNVSWSTTDNAAWLVASPGNGRGNGIINLLAIQANIGPERIAQLIINSTTTADADTVIVIQRTSGRFLIANPDTLFYAANAAPGQTASINANVNWTLTPNQVWILTSPSSGSNNGSSTITVQNNTSTARRIGYVVVSGTTGVMNDTIFIVQEAAISAPPTLSVNPMSITLAQPAGSSGMFTVNSTTSWQTQQGATWLNVINPTTTSDTGMVQVSAISMNLNLLPRASYVAVQDVAGTLFDTVFVFQAGLTPILVGNPDTILLGASSGSSGILNVGSTGSWTGVEGDTWFSLTQTSGSGVSMVNVVTNSNNTSSAQRVSFVALADVANNLTDTVVIIQDTATIGLITTPDTIRLNAAGSPNTFDVSTSLAWATSTPASWLTTNPGAGIGSGTVTVTATPNPMTTRRIDFIEVASSGGAIIADTVWVIQNGLVTNLDVSPNVINLNFANGSNDVISITSNTSWTINNPASWISLSSIAGSNDETITVTATSDNLTGSTRTATLTVDGIGAVSKIITVNQIDGSAPVFVSSKDTVFVENAQGSTGNFSILSNVNNWTLTENIPWLLVNPISGSQTESITVLVATRNILGVARYANITATASGFPNKTIVVAQKEATPFFQIAPDSIIIGADSASFTEFNVSSNMPAWTINEGATWLEISPETSSFTQRVRATAIEKNSTAAQRSTIATISAPPLVPQTIKIVQDTVRTIGIDEKSFEKAFTLYPNPSSGDVMIKIGNEFIGNGIEASLYNLIGEEIPVEVDFSNSSTALINLSDQANGIYFLRIRYRNEVFSKKISLIK